MLSSIKEFHQSRLLKEAHELEEKAKAEKGSRADAESEARSLLAGAPRLHCASATRCGSQGPAVASLRSLRLVGLCIILGLTSLIAVRSFSEPDTIEPEGDEVATTSFAGGDASEFTSWDRGGHPSWDGGPGDGFGAADMQELYHLAREDVLDVVSEGAESCDNWRKPVSARCADANDCGKGWLLGREGLLLTLPWAGVNGSNVIDEWPSGEARAVTVVGLKEGGNGEESDCNARDLSMLFRLQGPEALAEAGVPVEGRCAWSAVFRPLLEGTFTFKATIINWRGGREVHREMCNEVLGDYGNESVKMGGVPTGGGPFYGSFEGCCTLCTRAEGCVAWSATSDGAAALVNGDRCALYSSVSGEAVENKSLHGVVRSGTPCNEEAMVYLAPSMSLDRSWCAERNGDIMGSDKEFLVKASRVAGDGDGDEDGVDTPEGHAPTISVGLNVEAPLPLCRSNLLHKGRWVSLEDVKCDFHTDMITPHGWPNFNNTISMPEECYLKPGDKRARLDEVLRQFADGGYRWKPYKCQYDIMTRDKRRSCLKEKNITNFLDFGDRLLHLEVEAATGIKPSGEEWMLAEVANLLPSCFNFPPEWLGNSPLERCMTSTSRMPRSALWLPNVPSMWSNGMGARQVGTGAKQAGCTGHGIQYYAEDLQFDGALATHYCGVAADWQSPPGELLKLISSFKPDALLANWAIVHRLWHTSLEEFDGFLKSLGNRLDELAASGGHKPRYMFWLSLPFLVSEREPHCDLERAVQFNAAFRKVLQPRGWIEVDWMAMTRKWSFDIRDGMHHGEPPIRMLAYLLMHHICHGAE